MARGMVMVLVEVDEEDEEDEARRCFGGGRPKRADQVLLRRQEREREGR